MTWAKDPGIHVLATAKIPPTRSAGDHKDEVVPQIWTYEHTVSGGQPARAFVWMQGHTYANFANDQIQKTLLRGIAWAGKKPVDELVTYVAPPRPVPRRSASGEQGEITGRRHQPTASPRSPAPDRRSAAARSTAPSPARTARRKTRSTYRSPPPAPLPPGRSESRPSCICARFTDSCSRATSRSSRATSADISAFFTSRNACCKSALIWLRVLFS